MPLCLTDASNILLASRLAQQIMIAGLVFSPFRPSIHNLINNDGPSGFLMWFSHLSISRRILELYFPMVCPAGHRTLELPIFFATVFSYTLEEMFKIRVQPKRASPLTFTQSVVYIS